MVIVDAIKEERQAENEEIMEYDDFSKTDQYESLMVEPISTHLEAEPKLTSLKTSSKPKPSTSKSAAPRKTITKPLINLKYNIQSSELPQDSINQSINSDSSNPAEILRFNQTLAQPIKTDSTSLDTNNDNLETTEQQNVTKRPKGKRGLLPKQCTVCGLIVKRLRDHMKSHPEQLEFKCDQCPRTYLTKSGLDRHKDVQHADDR